MGQVQIIFTRRLRCPGSNQTVMLVRKWLNAKVSIWVIKYVILTWNMTRRPNRFSLSIIFLVADQSERGATCQIPITSSQHSTFQPFGWRQGRMAAMWMWSMNCNPVWGAGAEQCISRLSRCKKQNKKHSTAVCTQWFSSSKIAFINNPKVSSKRSAFTGSGYNYLWKSPSLRDTTNSNPAPINWKW